MWIYLINTAPMSDFEYYHNTAIQIANGGQWGNTYTSVGYSIFLALIYKIFGASIQMAKFTNVILSIINIIVVFLIFDRLNVDEKKKFFLLIVFAFFPSNIFYNSIIGSEILFTTILLIISYLYLTDSRYKYIMIGILVAINNMIKPFFIIFFIAIFLCDFLCYRKIYNALTNSLLVLVISLIALTPWLYRNYLLMGETTYVSNNGGIVLYINNNSQNKSGSWMDAREVSNSIVKSNEYKNANYTQKNKMLTKAAISWIITHPRHFIYLGTKRVINTYLYGTDLEYAFYGVKTNCVWQGVMQEIYTFIKKLFSLGGIIYFVSRLFVVIINKNNILSWKKHDVLFIFLFLMFTFIYFMTEGQPRYAFPLNFIFIYASYMLTEKIINWLRNKSNEYIR